MHIIFFSDMESKQMFLVVCVIGCAVSFIKAEGSISTPTTLTVRIPFTPLHSHLV